MKKISAARVGLAICFTLGSERSLADSTEFQEVVALQLAQLVQKQNAPQEPSAPQVLPPPPLPSPPPRSRPRPCPCPFTLSMKGEYGVYLVGELLYWKPLEGGTDYALPRNPIPSPSTPIPGKTSPQSISFEWEPGFRIGGGYHIPHDQWEVSATVSYVASSVTDRSSGTLFPSQALQSGLQAGFLSTQFATSAKASWKLNYWVLDVRMGREQSFKTSFLWLPYFGLRSGFIHQQFHTRYQGVVDGSATPQTQSVSTKNNFNGVGPQAGLRAEWVLGKGFRLFGDLSNALLYGWFNVNQDQIGSGNIEVMQFSDHFQRFSPTIDLMIGVSWRTDFLKGKCRYLEYHAAYQTQYWWRQNQMPRFIDSASPYYVLESEDLGIGGLTLGASLDF